MPQIWFMVEALIALARNRRDGKATFTIADLRTWSEKIGARPRSAHYACNHLEAHGLVRRVQGQAQGVQGKWNYALTVEGRAAAIEAEAARYREEFAAAAMADPSSFDHRVYSLLRTRRALSGPEAAETLVDAGEDVRAAARRAAACLSTWSKVFPQSIQPAARRVGGAVRYVLVQDLGPLAPSVTPPKNKAARGGAIA